MLHRIGLRASLARTAEGGCPYVPAWEDRSRHARSARSVGKVCFFANDQQL